MTKTCWKCKGEIPDVCKQCLWCGALFESEWSSRPPAYIARQEIQWDPDNPKIRSVIEDDDEKNRKRHETIQTTVTKVNRRVNSPSHRLSRWADRHRDATIVGAVACLVAIFVWCFSHLI